MSQRFVDAVEWMKRGCVSGFSASYQIIVVDVFSKLFPFARRTAQWSALLVVAGNIVFTCL